LRTTPRRHHPPAAKGRSGSFLRDGEESRAAEETRRQKTNRVSYSGISQSMRIVFRAANTFLAFLFLAKAAFALTVSCPSIGVGIPIGAFPPGFGCAEIDKSFSRFTDALLVGSLGPGAEFGFSAGGTAPVGDTMFPVTAELDVLGLQELTPSYLQEVAYTVVSNTGGSYQDGSYPTPATPGATWAISGLTFLPSITVNGDGQNCHRSRTILFECTVCVRLSISRCG
jgi:hypothetical protein